MVPSRDDTILRIRAAWRALRIVAWCLAATTMARADEPGWLVRSWQTDQGLPSSCVTAIAQTTDGFLWVGTAKGLARFDGLQFKGFDSLQLPELADGRISALRVDRRGALWIASGTGSLSCYEAGRFREIRRERQTAPEGPGDFMKDDTGRALPLPDLHRTALVEDADGGMWMLSGNNHLLCRHRVGQCRPSLRIR